MTVRDTTYNKFIRYATDFLIGVKVYYVFDIVFTLVRIYHWILFLSLMYYNYVWGTPDKNNTIFASHRTRPGTDRDR